MSLQYKYEPSLKDTETLNMLISNANEITFIYNCLKWRNFFLQSLMLDYFIYGDTN